MTPIVFDCDTGIDDSLALLYLLAHPSADLLAVLSTGGNVPTDVVCANNLDWLALCGREDIEVCPGAAAPLVGDLMTTEDTHGPRGIGYASLPSSAAKASDREAVQAWIDITAERPGEVVGLVTGPLTNLALAIRRDPDLPRRLRRLVIMGGTFDYPGNTTPTSEWNIAVDPESAHEVFTAFGVGGAPRPILCSLGLTEQIAMTPDHVARLAKLAGSTPIESPTPSDERGPRTVGKDSRSVASNSVVRHLTDAIRFYFEFHHDHDEGYIAHMHDPFAAAVALDPAIVTTEPACVDVELAGSLTRGTTVADRRNMWGRPANAEIATTTDPAKFFDDMITRVAALAATIG